MGIWTSCYNKYRLDDGTKELWYFGLRGNQCIDARGVYFSFHSTLNPMTAVDRCLSCLYYSNGATMVTTINVVDMLHGSTEERSTRADF